jgi:hypothetical protein
VLCQYCDVLLGAGNIGPDHLIELLRRNSHFIVAASLSRGAQGVYQPANGVHIDDAGNGSGHQVVKVVARAILQPSLQAADQRSSLGVIDIGTDVLLTLGDQCSRLAIQSTGGKFLE